MCVLTFIITVIFQWMKHYLTNVLGISDNKADFLFIIFSTTSPLLGVLFGGFIVQKIGGYSHNNCLYFMFFNSTICTILSIIIFFVRDYAAFSIIMWFIIFCGASIVPNLSGSIISTLPHDLKGSGYALSNILHSIFGHLPAGFVYGYMFDLFKNTTPSLALSICLSTSGLGAILMLLTIIMKTRNWYSKSDLEGDPTEEFKEKIMVTEENRF